MTRSLAAIACLIAAAGFVVAGAGILVRQVWSRPALIAAAAFSALLYLLFWNGKMQALDDQGGIGLLINLALLAVAFLIRWPVFEG
ncbi:MAG TPA: hypothetical protein VKA68_13050 [bacterium]|nr:hypothetical protein [bacterium]